MKSYDVVVSVTRTFIIRGVQAEDYKEAEERFKKDNVLEDEVTDERRAKIIEGKFVVVDTFVEINGISAGPV